MSTESTTKLQKISTKKRECVLLSLCERLDYSFSNLDLLHTALTHKSTSHKLNNERLEFLGDSLLNAATSILLFDSFPDEKEGTLSVRRSFLVCGKNLSILGEKFDLCPLILRSAQACSSSISKALLENAVEAIIAAIYLDSNFESVITFVKKHFSFNNFPQNVSCPDIKTALQELVQANALSAPTYHLIKKSGRSPNESFICACETSWVCFVGKGETRKAAERDAAAHLIEAIQSHPSKYPLIQHFPKKLASCFCQKNVLQGLSHHG